MSYEKEIKLNDFGVSMLMVSIFILMCAMFYWGYSYRADVIGDRISVFPNNQEECFTRQELDDFIYGNN